ncbi:MAG: hypothetical protein GY816_00900 [Cytophagales bacterium]|nr:hypothetical protein [Cytophagales bacterium]
MKKMTDEMRGNQSAIITQIDDVKKQVAVTNESFGKDTYAEMVCKDLDSTTLVLPMKQAIKEIEQDGERAKNVVVHGLDINPAIPHEQQAEKLKTTAKYCVEEIESSIKSVSDYKFGIVNSKILGKVGESSKAPPILLTMNGTNEARLLVRYANHLSKVKGLRKVFVTPDLSKDDRDKRRKLNEDLTKKIEEFPEEHWVIRQGTITSRGKFTPRKRLDDEDEGKEFDKSFDF